jgi:hypothetical protein
MMRRIMALALASGAMAATNAQAAQTAPPGVARPAAVTTSPDMSVAAFMARVDQLRPRGPDWPLSPEAGELFSAISAAGKAYRENLAKRLAAGQPVEACLPPEAQIESDVLLDHLASYSGEAAARTTIATAFSELVRQRFPCP